MLYIVACLVTINLALNGWMLNKIVKLGEDQSGQKQRMIAQENQLKKLEDRLEAGS